ncbi:MAG: YicC/YloC family endoribonuclease [Verrucomicrobiota bacterium]
MHSMTGFGRGEHTSPLYSAQVEAASVNRKQAEVVLNLPRGLQEIEPALRKHALARISRGRLAITLKLTPLDPAASSIQIDTTRAQALKNAFDQLANQIGQPLPLAAADFLRLPDQFLVEQTRNPDDLLPVLTPALDQALDQLLAMRANEGQDLQADLSTRLTNLQQLAATVAEIAPAVPTRQKELLLQRLADSGLALDPSDERVLKEIALFAERCDISEELTRLDSHFQKFTTLLNANEPVGRPLDFLCQELNREFNTIGSKANNSQIAHHIVTAKTELEKIREQVQNIE